MVLNRRVKYIVKRILFRCFSVCKATRRQFEDALLKIGRDIPANALVLDFASSANRYRNLFAQARYVGADIEYALPKSGFSEAEWFVNAELLRNPFRQEAFDYVISTNSLTYSSDDVEGVFTALLHLMNNLKPGGKLGGAASERLARERSSAAADTNRVPRHASDQI